MFYWIQLNIKTFLLCMDLTRTQEFILTLYPLNGIKHLPCSTCPPPPTRGFIPTGDLRCLTHPNTNHTSLIEQGSFWRYWIIPLIKTALDTHRVKILLGWKKRHIESSSSYFHLVLTQMSLFTFVNKSLFHIYELLFSTNKNQSKKLWVLLPAPVYKKKQIILRQC